MFETTLETIAVIAIVMSVLALVGRTLYRAMTGKNKGHCCGCDSCACDKLKQQYP